MIQLETFNPNSMVFKFRFGMTASIAKWSFKSREIGQIEFINRQNRVIKVGEV